MATSLETTFTSLPVITRTRIGEKFVGGVVNMEWRDRKKQDGTPILNAKGGQAREMVLTLMTRSGDMQVKETGGERKWSPEEGEIVRIILKTGGLAQFLDAKKALGRGLATGDLVALTTTHAVRYPPGDGVQSPIGEIRSNEELDAYYQDPTKRNENLGFRGDILVKLNDDPAFEARCDAAYQETRKRDTTPLEADPFPGPAPAAVNAASDDFWS